MCILWIDRHVHKNGGTTIRGVMKRLEEAGYAQKAVGWGLANKPLMELLATLRQPALRAPCSQAISELVIAVEAHDGGGRSGVNLFSQRVLGAVLALAAEPGACCRPLLTTRTRDPTEHYMSTWLWGAATRYAPFGRTLETWAPRNLQSVLMRDGTPTDRWIEGAKRWNRQVTPSGPASALRRGPGGGRTRDASHPHPADCWLPGPVQLHRVGLCPAGQVESC